jgi:hypothetical protein
MKIKNKLILLVGFILWPLIIAIPQFNANYAPGLLNGTLKYREIPAQFYIGLISGIFASGLVWILSFIIANLVTKGRNKEDSRSIIFISLTLFFFAFMLFSEMTDLLRALNLDEQKVIEARELIKQYDSNNARTDTK